MIKITMDMSEIMITLSIDITYALDRDMACYVQTFAQLRFNLNAKRLSSFYRTINMYHCSFFSDDR